MVSRHGGPEVLWLAEEELPEPQAGEVRVRVAAAGVSGFDLIYRRWARLPGSPPLPFTLGEDVVGIVDDVGPDVDSVEPGQMVAGATWSFGVGGGYSEHVCLPAADVVPVPDGVDPAEAVCLVVNYLTAHYHLHAIGQADEGERMLVHGAAGGVGNAVLDLGRLAGLEMFGTASTSNHDFVSSFGAVPIDYRTEDFVEFIDRATNGEGVDIVVDTVGGGRHLWRSHQALTDDGRLIWLGSAATKESGIRIGATSMLTAFALRRAPGHRQVPKCPTLDVYAKDNHEWFRRTLAEMLDHLAAGRLQPMVADRIPLAEAARAHEALERGGHRGKMVLVTDAYAGGG